MADSAGDRRTRVHAPVEDDARGRNAIAGRGDEDREEHGRRMQRRSVRGLERHDLAAAFLALARSVRRRSGIALLVARRSAALALALDAMKHAASNLLDARHHEQRRAEPSGETGHCRSS